jgi:hypothetical protein
MIGIETPSGDLAHGQGELNGLGLGPRSAVRSAGPAHEPLASRFESSVA